MRPQDIEKIANSVVGVFGRPIRASAGCAGVSDPQAFDCSEYDCSVTYICGGQGTFSCGTNFGCVGDFTCDSNFDCTGGYVT